MHLTNQSVYFEKTLYILSESTGFIHLPVVANSELKIWNKSDPINTVY